MSLNNTFFEQLQKLEASAQLNKTAAPTFAASIELYPNRYDEISVDRPFYLENAIVASAADKEYNPMDAKQEKLLREKKHPVKPEDLVEKAHPKAVYVSNALGDGGLVENQNEQHQKLMEVIFKLPTGNLVHIHAQMLTELVKIANELEIESPEAAAKVDEVIAALAGRELERLNKEAVFPLVPVLIGAGILAGVSALGAGVWNAIKGTQEKLDTDTAQLVSNIESWKDDQEYAAQRPLSEKLYQAALQLNQLSTQLMAASADLVANPSADAEQRANEVDQRFGHALSQTSPLVGALKQQLPSTWFTSLEGKLEDVESDYKLLHAQIAAAAGHAAEVAPETPADTREKAEQAQAPAAAPSVPDPERIKSIQQYLTSVGFGPLAATGKADSETKRKLVELEVYLNRSEVQDGKLKMGLGVGNLPGNRLAKLLDSSLTADQLTALVELFKNPYAAVAEELPPVPEK